jgi:SAM-dependent methyltransferase
MNSPEENKAVLSPVTKTGKCVVYATLETKKIVSQYKSELDIDVSGYFQHEKVNVYECKDSGYRFYHPKELMADGAFYELLEQKTNNTYYSKRWEHVKALDFIKSNDAVLDIGCGSGKFLKMVKEQKKASVIEGLELNLQCVELLRGTGYVIHNKTIEEFGLEGKKFDVISAFQVLEHIYDVASFVEGCISCLKPGGKIIIGVPNNNPFILKHDTYHTLNLPPHHMGLWNVGSLKNMGLQFGLRTVFGKVEHLQQHKEWFLVQRAWLISRNPIYHVLKIIPRPVYKFFTKLFSTSIDGMYCLSVFEVERKY